MSAARPRFVPQPHLEEMLLRFGYLSAGAFMLHAAYQYFWMEADALWHPVALGASLLAYVWAAALLLNGLRRPVAPGRHWWILGAYLYTFLAQYGLRLLTEKPAAAGVSDSALLSGFGALLQSLGHNPYTWNLHGAYTAFRVSNYFITPTLDGGYVASISYPALHFLALLPLRWLGVEDLRLVYVLAYAGLLALVFLRSPTWLRGIVLLPMVINPDPARSTLGAVSDSVWALLLALMLVSWRRPAWRAIFFGLACAYKQTPWLLLPFLLARIFLDEEDSDARSPLARSAFFAALAGLVFLLPNLPYLVAAPAAWARGVLEPAANALIYFGSGLSQLTQLGYLPLPKAFYSLAALLALAFLLAVYILRFDRWRDAAILFPGIILWFSYRSLQSYFIFWAPLAALTMVEALRAPAMEGARVFTVPGGLHAQLMRVVNWGQRRATWLLPALGAGFAAALLAGLAYFVSAAHPLRIERIEVFADQGVYQVRRLELVIANPTSRPVRPRIAVQKGAWEPYPWEIESGPEELAPGARGVYRARTDLGYRMFSLADGAQVVVSDANGDYRAWGARKIAPETALLDPDAVYNPGYWRAADPGATPYGWSLDWQAAQAPMLDAGVDSQGFASVRLALTPGVQSETWEYAGLRQAIPFPSGDLSLWVYPSGPAHALAGVDDLDYAYGLETVDAGGRRLWILFGERGVRGFLEPEHYVVQYALPRQAWSEQRVNLAQIYAGLGWPLPAPQRTLRGADLELDERTITVRLLLAARRQPQALPLAARFGPLRSLPAADPVRRRVEAMLASPGQYWMSIAEHEMRYRNYERARALYVAALDDPQVLASPEQLGEVYQALGWIDLRLGDVASARQHFDRSLQVGGQLPAAVCGLGLAELNSGQPAKADDLFQISDKMGYPCNAGEEILR